MSRWHIVRQVEINGRPVTESLDADSDSDSD
jgi:hypothetical protein